MSGQWWGYNHKMGSLIEIDQFIYTAVGMDQFPKSGIVCLLSTISPLKYIDMMPRTPMPKLEFFIDGDFAKNLIAANKLNPSIHDGAIVAIWEKEKEKYSVRHMSCRLLPPQIGNHSHQNRGSAFNSALAMSNVMQVQKVYFWSNRALHLFESGNLSKSIQVVEKI